MNCVGYDRLLFHGISHNSRDSSLWHY